MWKYPGKARSDWRMLFDQSAWKVLTSYVPCACHQWLSWNMPPPYYLLITTTQHLLAMSCIIAPMHVWRPVGRVLYFCSTNNNILKEKYSDRPYSTGRFKFIIPSQQTVTCDLKSGHHPCSADRSNIPYTHTKIKKYVNAESISRIFNTHWKALTKYYIHRDNKPF